MIALKRILVPHDFSETSAEAVRYAIALARNFGATLYFLHVSHDAVNQFEWSFQSGSTTLLKTASANDCSESSRQWRRPNSILNLRSGLARPLLKLCAMPKTRISI